MKKETEKTETNKKETIKKKTVKKEINKKDAVKTETIMKEINKKEMFSVKEVIWLLVITCVANICIFFLINPDFSIDDNTKYDDNLKQIMEAYNYIKDNYYEDIDDEVLINGAIKGMTGALGDDYSSFIEEADSDTYNIYLKGEYVGVGIQIVQLTSGEIVVSSIIKNSPAEKTDLQVNDIIKKVNDKDATTMTTTEVSNYIKNGKDNSFVIVIERDGQTKTIEVKRGQITLDSVTSEIITRENKKIGYIHIDLFALNTANQMKEHLAKLEDEGINSLIIDVRGNTGGHLVAATSILSEFLDNKQIMYQTDTKGSIEKVYSKGKNKKDYPIILLGNSESASASEILISALTENNVAKFVGETTFGKGTVQELVNIQSTGEEYKITTKKWLTPNGNWINKTGIKPDYEEVLSSDYYENPSKETDNQLNKAIELLVK